MSNVYVLVLTIFLQGGDVRTDTITSSTHALCEAAKVDMISLYTSGKLRVVGSNRKIDHITPICFEVG